MEDLKKIILLPNDEITKILINSYYQKSILESDNIDVDINHLENIFTDKSCKRKKSFH